MIYTNWDPLLIKRTNQRTATRSMSMGLLKVLYSLNGVAVCILDPLKQGVLGPPILMSGGVPGHIN